MRYLKFIALLFSMIVNFIHVQGINIEEGKQIFTSRCASCHSINKKVVGPALRDVDKRHTGKWIIDFVHSSQTVIKSGDEAAVALFNSHGQTIMPDHTDLKADQIQSIISYIKEQSLTPPLAPVASNLSLNKPYYNKNSLLNRIVYLNFEGNHTPIKPTDYMSWFLIAVIVIVLITVLYVVVYVNLIVDKNDERKSIKDKVLTIPANEIDEEDLIHSLKEVG